MNIKKNTFIKLLAAVLSTSLLLSSCGTETVESSATDALLWYDIEEIKKVQPPEDRWTHEQISEVMYLCGKPFSLPCKLEDLPDDFEIGKVRYRDKNTDILDGYISVNGQDIGFYDAHLLLDGESIGLVYYYEDGAENTVFGVDLDCDLYERDILVINGINQNSLFSEVEQALGEFTLVEDCPIPCFYDYEIMDSEYPEEHIRVMIVNDYEDEEMGIADEEGIIGFCYSLFEVKTNETIEWSPDDVCSIECNGIEIEFPCMLSDVEKNFDTEISESQSGRDDIVELYLGNEYVGAMSWLSEEYDSEKDCLDFIRLESFSFNGLTEKSSKDDIQKKLGKGTEMDFEYADWYYGDRVHLGFEYYENTAIVISVFGDVEED